MIMSKQFFGCNRIIGSIGYIVGSIRVPRTTPGENEKRDSSSCTGGKF